MTELIPPRLNLNGKRSINSLVPNTKRAKAAEPKFVWDQKEWTTKKQLSKVVAVMSRRMNPKQLVVKKVLDAYEDEDMPNELQILKLLPECNRIVNFLTHVPEQPEIGFHTAIFEFHTLGDILVWKTREYDLKNYKPVPESYIWRFFLQMAQALAFIQNYIGPNRKQRRGILHRDIKPQNILVVNNGTTYPSFKLHDFGIAREYSNATAGKKSYSGTFPWQPPENPLINTLPSEIWALGACVHYLAVGREPTEHRGDFLEARLQEDPNPPSARHYSSISRYAAARVPRWPAPINLTEEEQRDQGLGPYYVADKLCYNPRYSDELNAWMLWTLRHKPNHRPTAGRLIRDMTPVAEGFLRRMGGEAALADIDVLFGTDSPQL